MILYSAGDRQPTYEVPEIVIIDMSFVRVASDLLKAAKALLQTIGASCDGRITHLEHPHTAQARLAAAIARAEGRGDV